MAPRISTPKTKAAILGEREKGKTYRAICAENGLPERDAATLCNIVKDKPVSASNERRIRRKLKLDSPTRSYTPRPVTTKEQERRRAALGAQWRDVIDAGLDALEQKGAE